MEKFNIISGSYREAMEGFLQQKKIPFTASADEIQITAEDREIASGLGEFLQQQCLFREAKRALDRSEPMIAEQAAGYAVSCVNQDIEQLLLEYLSQSHNLHLEGFLRFRMRAIVAEVRYLAKVRARELVQEEQYRDFLMLLQTYVKECVPLVDTVLLLADGAGQHHLFTENGVEITYDYADLEDAESLENEDDVILSSLLTIAPRTVYLYGKDRSANPCLVDTIRKIFSVREIC